MMVQEMEAEVGVLEDVVDVELMEKMLAEDPSVYFFLIQQDFKLQTIQSQGIWWAGWTRQWWIRGYFGRGIPVRQLLQDLFLKQLFL
jgi:hypothetical protein